MNITIIILLLITIMNIIVGARVKEPFVGKRVIGGVVDAFHTAGIKVVKDNMSKSQKESYKPVFRNLKKTVESFREVISGSEKKSKKKKKKSKKEKKK